MDVLVSGIILFLLVIEKLLKFCNSDHYDKILTLIKGNTEFFNKSSFGRLVLSKFGPQILTLKENIHPEKDDIGSISIILNDSSDEENNSDNQSIHDYLINNIILSDINDNLRK